MSGRMRRAAVIAALAVAATSCGGSGSGNGATGGVAVTMKDFSIEATPGTFAAGNVSFAIHNAGPSAHEFV